MFAPLAPGELSSTSARDLISARAPTPRTGTRLTSSRKKAMSAVPFAGVGKPFQKHAERHAAGTPRDSIDEFEGRAMLALPREGASKDGERPWFSGQVVAVDGSRRQFQLLATPLPPCEDGCKCSGGDGAASGGDFLRLPPADPS